MRWAMLAAVAGWVGLAEPALALDKVRFGTNWLAGPEAGGFYQALADGTYEKFGLDVTIIPGGPQANGALMLLFGKLEFFMGGDMIGNLLSAEAKLPLVAVAANFQEEPADPHVASGTWAWTNGRICTPPRSAGTTISTATIPRQTRASSRIIRTSKMIRSRFRSRS
jgi:NitT/TauT family transport system substrate-binding protein